MSVIQWMADKEVLPTIVNYEVLINTFGESGQWAAATYLLDEARVMGLDRKNTLMVLLKTMHTHLPVFDLFAPTLYRHMVEAGIITHRSVVSHLSSGSSTKTTPSTSQALPDRFVPRPPPPPPPPFL